MHSYRLLSIALDLSINRYCRLSINVQGRISVGQCNNKASKEERKGGGKEGGEGNKGRVER